MRILNILAASLCAAALLAADNKVNGLHSDNRLIQGRWKVIASEEAGAAQQFAEEAYFVIKDDTISVRPSRGHPITLKYQLDPAQEPKAIDTSHEIDRGRPISQLGIYSIEGDKLKLCIAGRGQPRPANFESKAGVLLTLKRDPQGEQRHKR